MAVFKEAIDVFQTTKQKLEGTQSRLNALKTFLEDLQQALRVADRVGDALRRIGRAAEALRRVLNAIRVPPAGPWGAALRALKEAVELLLRAVDAATESAGDALRRLDTIMARLRRRIAAMMVVVDTLLTRVGEALGILGNLIAVCEFLEQQQDFLEDLLGEEWVAEIRRLLRGLAAFHASIDAFNDALDDLTRQMEPIVQDIKRIVEELNNLADQLEQFADELDALRSQMDTAIQQALDLINGLPDWAKNAIEQAGKVLEWLEDQIRPLIQPIIDALDDAGLFDAIDALRDRIAEVIDPITEKAKEVKEQLESLEQVIETLETTINEAQQTLERLVAHLRTLEGFLGLLALVKLLWEYYLRYQTDRMWQPLTVLAEGDLAEMLTAGEAHAHVAIIDEVVGQLAYAVERTYPRFQGTALVGGLARFATDLDVGLRLAESITGRPTPFDGAGRIAHAIGRSNVPEKLAEILGPMRSVVLGLASLNTQLGRLVAQADGDADVDLEAIHSVVKRMLAFREPVAEVTIEPDLETLPPGYFEQGLQLMGLPIGDGGAEVAQAKTWGVTSWNNTRQAANDLHITLAGTGGSLRNPRIIVQPKGCNGRAVITDGNRIDVTWNKACVQPGDTVIILVETDFVPLQTVQTVWTLDGEPIEE